MHRNVGAAPAVTPGLTRFVGACVVGSVPFAAPGCIGYRAYPLLQIDVPGVRAPLEWSGVALLPDRTMVAIAEGDAEALFAPDPRVPIGTGGIFELFALHDSREDCLRGGQLRVHCADRHFRAAIRMRREPIHWLPRERRITIPHDVEDLAALGPNLVIGVTQYNAIGRKSGYRKDYTARSRRQTEQLFVLEREGDAWRELRVPTIDRLRDSLSDWGRGHCQGDMLVEGLAYDPDNQRVFVGLARCDGPALRVLGYDLGASRAGLAADLVVEADGLFGATPGPEEGLTGLTFAQGRLWALSAWDSYGYDTEPAYGGRIHEVKGGKLVPVDVPGEFRDRPSAIAVLAEPDHPGAAAEDLDVLVLFDNDAAARDRKRPDATVLSARTPRPEGDGWAQLRSIEAITTELPLALNGFDLRWYSRDHRLSQMAFLLSRLSDGTPGGWTRALGGRWQMEVGGSMGLWSETLGIGGKSLGQNKQAVAFTDFSGMPDVHFTRYRARVSVIPRDRERQNPSVAALLDLPEYRVQATLPVAAVAGAGLVLQGFAVDTSSRAAEGMCLAAMQLGVDWSDADHRTVVLQASLVGGICNDYDTRGTEFLHGRTTTASGGVDVTLYFAVVDGVETTSSSARIFDRDLPAPRNLDGTVRGDPQRALGDAAMRAHVYCTRLGNTGTLTMLPPAPQAPPNDWLRAGSHVVGPVAGAAGALRGFSLALDPAGFDPALAAKQLTDAEALARNNYVYRYLVRAFVDPTGAFLEGGISHGIHRTGLARDNARPSAMLLGADLTVFPTLSVAPVVHDFTTLDPLTDPNLLPEDGFPRWSVSPPRTEAPSCSPGW